MELVMVTVIACALAFGIVRFLKKDTDEVPMPSPGTKIRLVAPGGAYRSFFVSSCPKCIVVSAPIFADCHVPIREGEKVWVQAPRDGQLVCFWSVVKGRDPDTKELVLDRPNKYKVVERRTDMRYADLEDADATVDNERAMLNDLSVNGAFLTTSAQIEPGDRVVVGLPAGLGSCDGWVLSTRSGSMHGRAATEARIRFCEPVTGVLTAVRRLTVVQK